MPVYEYQCTECGNKFERLLPMNAADDLVVCGCGGRGQRVMSRVIGFVKDGFGQVTGLERSQRRAPGVGADTGGYADWIGEAGGS